MNALIIAETVILALLTVLVAGLLRAYGSVLARLHRLDGGAEHAGASNTGGGVFAVGPAPRRRPDQPTGLAPAHDVSGLTVAGEAVHARTSEVEHDTLLLFLSSGCASCATFWEELRRPAPLPNGTRLLVVTQDSDEESISDLVQLIPPSVDVVLSSQAWRDYEVPGSPYAVLVDGREGRVRGEGTGQSLRQVTALVASSGDALRERDPELRKSRRDRRDEVDVDQALLAAGIAPGDPRLYGGAG